MGKKGNVIKNSLSKNKNSLSMASGVLLKRGVIYIIFVPLFSVSEYIWMPEILEGSGRYRLPVMEWTGHEDESYSIGLYSMVL